MTVVEGATPGPGRVRPARQLLRRAAHHLGVHPAVWHLGHVRLRTPAGDPAPPAHHPTRKAHLPAGHDLGSGG
ncbi:MAG: hypothetical protein MZV64_59400 [Ignavibacteriales bacterium]|nr:hypothetical protein [Ignavibacteriales bacterium]